MAVKKCLEINKNNRPQTISEFVKIITQKTSSSDVTPKVAPVISTEENTLIDIGTTASGPTEDANQNKYRSKLTTDADSDSELVSEDDTENPKYGFWLKFFLFTVCASGIGLLISSIIYYSETGRFINEAFAILNIVMSVAFCGLSIHTVYSFAKKKSDAVFLGKLYLVFTFVYQVALALLTDIDSEILVEVTRSLIWCVIWFIYLCVSKRVNNIIPNSTRQIVNKDYVISGIFVILFILFIATYGVEQPGDRVEYVEEKEYTNHYGTNFKFTGEVIGEDLPNGEGIGYYQGKDYQGEFRGEYVDGARVKGEYITTNGKDTTLFNGTFENDHYSNGYLYYDENSYFYGTFRNDAPYNGTYYEKDKVIGKYVDGKFKQQ